MRAEEERSPSPSPRRRPLGSSQKLQELTDMAEDDEGDEEEEEDEETLQLKLQVMETKLRLKKLQAKKKESERSHGRRSEESIPSARSASPRKLYESALPRAAVQVPVSPAANRRSAPEQVSPARARLGLTTNPRATDVSLKRARDGSHITRSNSQRSLNGPREELPKVKSFGERLAESRQKEEDRHVKHDRLQQIRSTGFNHARKDSIPSSKSTPTLSGRMSRPDEMARPSSAGRALDSRVGKEQPALSRTASARLPCESKPRPHANDAFKSRINPGAEHPNGTGHAEDDSDDSLDIQDTHPDFGYDSFSKTHLSKRHISHSVVAREMEGTEIYTLPRLLKEVKAPEYEPPDCEADYIVFGILASKSSPYDHAQTHRTNEQAKDNLEAPRNKFMVLHLCDLKWELDCFLFGTAFNQFWKLTPGTLLAIKNPAVMPPKGNQNNGRFSLKLGSSEDAVMEIGIARDLGYCSAVKKDGQQCGEWVDKRKAEACEFHLNLQIEKSRKGRMEVNTMFTNGNRDNRNKSKVAKDNRLKDIGGKYHREYGQLYSVPGTGKSAASLLDDDDKRIYDSLNEEEASRKRIAKAQKERDLERQLQSLTETGRGVGAEYLRARQTTTTTTTRTTTTTSAGGQDAADEARNALFAKKSASELGLLGKKASDAHLSPSKDRRKHFGLGAIAMPSHHHGSKHKSSEPMGWGGARKAGLLQPKESRLGSPERGQTRLDVERTKMRSNLVRSRSKDGSGSSIRSSGSQSPTKKKARFDLVGKGIKVPGRESLPGQQTGTGVLAAGSGDGDDDDDDDDDLDIV